MTSDGQNAWNASIDAEAFRRQRDVDVLEVQGGTKGTTVSFPLDAAETTSASARLTAERCAQYFPLTVHYMEGDNEPVELGREDFLDGAERVVPFESGRIGLFKGSRSSRDPVINLLGLTITGSVAEVGQVYGDTYHARLDLTDAAGVQLALPARTAVIDNDAWQGLRVRAETELYRLIADHGEHDLAFEDYEQGGKLGIDLPAAARRLKLWSPDYADDCVMMNDHFDRGTLLRDVPSDAIILETNDAVEGQCFALAKEGEPFFERFFEPECRFAGYEWYDALPKAEIGWHIEKDGSWMEIGSLAGIGPVEVDGVHFDEFPDTAELERWDDPDTITAILRTSENVVAQAKVDCLVFGEYDWPGDVDVIARAGGIDPSDLADLMRRAFFSANDDHDTDSWQTQSDNFDIEAKTRAIEVLEGRAAAEIALLEATADEELRWRVPKGKVAHLTVTNAGTVVRLEDEPAEAA